MKPFEHDAFLSQPIDTTPDEAAAATAYVHRTAPHDAPTILAALGLDGAT